LDLISGLSWTALQSKICVKDKILLKYKVLLTWNVVVATFQFKEKIEEFCLGNFKCLEKANFPKHFVSHL